MEDSLFMQASDMKRFLIKVVFFFFLMALLDVCFGFICDYLREHARGGDIKRFNDLFLKDRHEVLVFGSSRARHHYASNVLEKNLKVECYNAGYGGHGVILAYPLLESILERYKPQLIVFDITKESDFLVFANDNGNTRYISILKPWCRIPVVSEVIKSVSFTDFLLARYSSMFRYNSQFIYLLGDNILSRKVDDKGFAPLYGTVDMRIYKKSSRTEKSNHDQIKIYWLKRFAKLKEEKKLNMVWVISPIFEANSSDYKEYEFVREIAKSHDIPFFDYYLDSSFVEHSELFTDSVHLNETGALLFTERFAKDLKLLKEKNNP